MAIESSPVAAGIRILAEQFNKLRRDLLVNHDHTAGQGNTVAHSSLSDGAITGTYITHATINKHIQYDGTNPTPDAWGGPKGVHGLGSDIWVAGCGGSNQLVIQAGYETPGSGGSKTFPKAYTTVLAIIVTPYQGNDSRSHVTEYDTGHFHWSSAGSPTGIFWVAVGTV